MELLPIDVWQLFLGAVVSSGVVVVGIESFREWRFKKKDEFVERTKLKVEILSKSAPYYNQLSMNAWNFAWSVVCENPEKQDKERIMFHMCNMLYFREEIIKKFGGIQFDRLGCRRDRRGIWRQVKFTIEEEFSFVDVSRLICMVKEDIPLHRFHQRVSVKIKTFTINF